MHLHQMKKNAQSVDMTSQAPPKADSLHSGGIPQHRTPSSSELSNGWYE